MPHFSKHFYHALALIFVILACKKTIKPVVFEESNNTTEVAFYLTTANQTALLQNQKQALNFGTIPNSHSNIEIDSTKTYQTVDGFGYMLTGASAFLIQNMEATAKVQLLQELFGKDPNSLGISYLRISIGASDLHTEVFTYNDTPSSLPDPTLNHFSLEKDRTLLNLLKEILAINPSLKILATPWTAPLWMKDNKQSVGGSLMPEYYNSYAQYLVKYLKAMQAEGINIEAITIQNEPLNPNNNPSMYMTAAQQATFIGQHLGPAIRLQNSKTKIIIYDHNCDQLAYPLSILSDPVASTFIDGSAFHLYGGDIAAMGTVHEAFPNKNLYFTEQYTGANGQFAGDLRWHLKNVIIGAMRNWSRSAIEWNLASDAKYELHTPGGCNECKGALTITGNQVSRNVSYYIIGHIAKFVPAGSQRLQSNHSGSLYTVAFMRPDGKKVLIALNDGADNQTFNIKFGSKWTTTALPAGAVGTYVWF
jgi:glucosylceramidase